MAKKKNSIKDKVKSVVFSTQGMPIFLTVAVLSFLFVLFRMKGVELDYQIISSKKEIERINSENKELKAKKAGLLSVKSLRRIAKKHSLKEPNKKQIIVIP